MSEDDTALNTGEEMVMEAGSILATGEEIVIIGAGFAATRRLAPGRQDRRRTVVHGVASVRGLAATMAVGRIRATGDGTAAVTGHGAEASAGVIEATGRRNLTNEMLLVVLLEAA